MKAPIEPKKEDCCNSGCNPCIFDVYDKQLRQYKLYIECGESSEFIKENAISQLKYTKFYLKENINICEQHKILVFKLSSEPDKPVFWNPGQHFLVKYQSDKGTFSRAYTPIKLEKLNKDHEFAIIVKRYNTGAVSSYLCDMIVGEISYWRGPYGQYQIDSEKTRLIMIAQGTGIAPMFSIIKHILCDEENMTKIILIFCCKSIDMIPLRDELYSLNSYWNFEYVIHLSNLTDKTLLKYKEPILTNKLTGDDVQQMKPFTEKDQFLICGSDEFMKHYFTVLETNVPSVNIVKF